MNPQVDISEFLDLLDELLDGGHYDWARGTLTGIRSTVTRTRQVTDGQRQAVARIAASRRDTSTPDLPSQRRPGSRRYEGWEPGR